MLTHYRCEFPEETAERLRLLLAGKTRRRMADEFHGRLASYTYSGGGTCRRCSGGRRLRDLKEVSAKTVCSYAESALMGAKIAANTMDEAANSYEEVIDLAAAFYDQKKGQKLVVETEKSVRECEEHGRMAKAEAKLVVDWCEQAKRETDMKRLEECVKNSEKSYKRAMQETEKVIKSLHQVTDVKVMFMKEEVKQEAKRKGEDVKNIVSMMIADIDKRVEDIKALIATTLEQANREKDMAKKQSLEQQAVSLEGEKKGWKQSPRHPKSLWNPK